MNKAVIGVVGTGLMGVGIATQSALHGHRTIVHDVDPARLAAAVEAASPVHLAFNGKNAARAALGRAVAYGLQPERIGGAQVWALPSTSGAARGFWEIEPWRELARAALAA